MERVITTYVDDLTGKEYEEGETVEFGFDGKTYEIDLAKVNARKLRNTLEKYAQAGRKVKAHKVTRSSAHAGRTAVIRDWAVKNGYEIGTKGRIPAKIQEAYDKVH